RALLGASWNIADCALRRAPGISPLSRNRCMQRYYVPPSGEVRKGAEAGSTGRERPLRAETLHESERTRVARLFFAERTVIRKEPLGPNAALRLRHEVAILRRLRGVPGT